MTSESGGLLLVAVFTVSVALVPMLLLNARDRREAALLETMWCLVPRELRDLVAIQVHCPLLWGRSVVEVALWGCGRDEIGDAVARWCGGLRSGARLVVDVSVDRACVAASTSRARGGRRRLLGG